MRYWWVNQNQTYRHEVSGGYLWSPKRKANNDRNPFYDFMREVAPGDVIFSFADTYVKAIGFSTSFAYEAPKPLEFGRAGAYWDRIGWRVDVQFVELRLPMRPSQNMEALRAHLPQRYAPLRPTGEGLQSVYLTTVAPAFAGAIIDLIGAEAREIVRGHRAADASTAKAGVGLLEWEEHEIERVRDDSQISDTTREALILARRGQGLFKERVRVIEKACRVTRVDQIEHLRASHCKPWRDATNEERLDGENGLLLTPSIDHLLDRGFIGFEDNGDLLISPVVHRASVAKMGIDPERPPNVGRFSSGQQRYLEFHREYVLLRSRFIG
jgi:hypothetical protein